MLIFKFLLDNTLYVKLSLELQALIFLAQELHTAKELNQLTAFI